MEEEFFVGMGEFIVKHNPAMLVSLGLGSCVGCALYDAEAKIGGLAHVMLPSSVETKTEHNNMNKFADIAVPAMIDEMTKQGCKKERMVAKLAGGAHMFIGLVEMEGNLNIGKRNSESVKNILSSQNIKIVAEDLGGQVGRTVHFDTVTGKLNIKTKDGLKDI